MTFQHVVAIREFILQCVLPHGYHFPEVFHEAVALTPAGKAIDLPDIGVGGLEVHPGDVAAALLGAFADKGQPLIDIEGTDTVRLVQALHEEVAARRVQFPWVFGRSSTEAFAARYGHRGADILLTHEQSAALLSEGPQGVFQIHGMLAGPFGILTSKATRSLAPNQTAAAALCSRSDCELLHAVQHRTGQTASSELYTRLEGAMGSTQIQQINDVLIPDDLFYKLASPVDLPWLLGNGLTTSELRALAARLLRDNIDGTRQLTVDLLGPKTQRKSAEAILLPLSDAHVLQLCLVLTDAALVEQLEVLVEDGTIAVAPTEVRMSPVTGGRPTAYDTSAQLSRQGVRFYPRTTGSMASKRTEHLLQQVFAGDAAPELEWLLRAVPGRGLAEKLNGLLRTVPPDQVLRQLLFSSRSALLRAFAALEYGHFAVPTSAAEEDSLLRKILWKLGHAMEPPPALDQQLLRYLDDFAAVSADGSGLKREEATRSAGSNVFVELEKVVTRVVHLCAWSLFSDHYTRDIRKRWVYTEARAAERANGVLSAKSNEMFRWEASGNTLYPLFQAFGVLSDLCEATASREAELLRPEAEFPLPVRYGPEFKFPLRHVRLVLDLEPSSVTNLVSAMRQVLSEADRSGIAATRNALSHSGPDFPDDDAVGRAVRGVHEILRILKHEGLLPSVYVKRESVIDAFDRQRVTLVDASEDVVVLHEARELMHCDLPASGQPQLILKGAVFLGTQQPARFRVEEDSDWAGEWLDFASAVADGDDAVEQSLRDLLVGASEARTTSPSDALSQASMSGKAEPGH